MMNESLPISCISSLYIRTLYLFSPVASLWLQMVWLYSVGGRQKAPPPPLLPPPPPLPSSSRSEALALRCQV